MKVEKSFPESAKPTENDLLDMQKRHKKKQKGLSPFSSLTGGRKGGYCTDAGNVLYNIAMFNHMNDIGGKAGTTMPIIPTASENSDGNGDNEISSAESGTGTGGESSGSTSGGMGESMEEIKRARNNLVDKIIRKPAITEDEVTTPDYISIGQQVSLFRPETIVNVTDNSGNILFSGTVAEIPDSTKALYVYGFEKGLGDDYIIHAIEEPLTEEVILEKLKPQTGRFVVQHKNGRYVSDEFNVGSIERAARFETKDDAEKFISDNGEDKNWSKNYQIKELSEDFSEYYDEEESPLKVCKSCLLGIESHEGPMITKHIFVDDEDEEESRCEWCGETGFADLYVIEDKTEADWQ